MGVLPCSPEKDLYARHFKRKHGKLDIVGKGNTPYSKMPENTLLFCPFVNWPLLPRAHLQNSKEYLA